MPGDYSTNSEEGQTWLLRNASLPGLDHAYRIILDNPMAQCYNPYDSGYCSPCVYAYPGLVHGRETR